MFAELLNKTKDQREKADAHTEASLVDAEASQAKTTKNYHEMAYWNQKFVIVSAISLLPACLPVLSVYICGDALRRKLIGVSTLSSTTSLPPQPLSPYTSLP